MMNDEELIELLKKIKQYCEEKDGCDECNFKYLRADCFFTKLGYWLEDIPQDWEIGEIERIVRL